MNSKLLLALCLVGIDALISADEAKIPAAAKSPQAGAAMPEDVAA